MIFLLFWNDVQLFTAELLLSFTNSFFLMYNSTVYRIGSAAKHGYGHDRNETRDLLISAIGGSRLLHVSFIK